MKKLNDDNKLEAFLKELGELSDRYGFQIAGCGCCGSPYLMKFEGSNLNFNVVAESLEFNRDTKTYSIEKPHEISCYNYDDTMYLADGTELTDQKMEEILEARMDGNSAEIERTEE